MKVVEYIETQLADKLRLKDCAIHPVGERSHTILQRKKIIGRVTRLNEDDTLILVQLWFRDRTNPYDLYFRYGNSKLVNAY